MILDTNALSAFVDGDATVGDILRREPRAVIPVIVLGEFRYGIAQSRHRRTYETWLDKRLPGFDVLPITEATAIEYAALRVELNVISGQRPPRIRHLRQSELFASSVRLAWRRLSGTSWLRAA